MQASAVDAGVQAVLEDASREHWTLANIYQWIYEGELVLAEFAPKALTQTVDITLTSREVKHALAVGHSKLIDVTHNLGSDGTTPGRAITFTGLDRLQAVRPSWRSEEGSYVRHFMVDERDPRTWYTWPLVASTWHVEARVIVAPAVVTALTDTLATDESYLPALIDYVLHRAYAKDAEEAANGQLSGAHYAAFASKIGMKIQKWAAASPARNSGESPQYPVVEKTGN
jgi:hypothetical protein